MLAGIQDVLIISTPTDISRFEDLLGDGSEIGMKFQYKVQPSPDGLAQAFILGNDFIGNDDVCLILGDNIFYGHGMTGILEQAVSEAKNSNVATVFGYYVKEPQHYGVVEFDNSGQVKSIEEKPIKPRSNFAVTGLYFYPNDVIHKAILVEPSERGELEITSLNQLYLNDGNLKVEVMSRGYAWLDTGTHENLLDASAFIETIEKRQGLKVACLEEISLEKGFISRDEFKLIAQNSSNNQYGQYLLDIANSMD